jgi:hypothetical protein
MDDALINGHIASGAPQMPRRLSEKCMSRRCRRLADLHASNLDRETSRGKPLVRGQQRITLNYSDTRQLNIELFRGDLSHRGAHARSQIYLPRKHSNVLIRGYREKGIHFVKRHGLRGLSNPSVNAGLIWSAREKPTIRMPPLFRKSRRVFIEFKLDSDLKPYFAYRQHAG